jgi:7,8-dihydropterin-6-yl-methyl-4-(beta-D-ribofuranosyl)aminobenzene 5'-phosphate synthase
MRFNDMIRKLKVTTLVDNYSLLGSRFWAEHGLSFLIEADGEKILFDTGQTGEVIGHNLDYLNQDLTDLNYVVLSHGHYDHTGGLNEIAKRTENPTVFAHPNVFDDKYALKGSTYKPIGIPFRRNKLKKSLNFRFNKNGKEIIDGVRTTGFIPREINFEKVPEMYCIKKNGNYIKDEIIDDQALILETRKGIVVILGCTHSGVINTLNQVSEITGDRKIWGVLGGTHLRAAKKARLQKTAWVLKRFKIQTIGLSHCSGENTFFHLSNLLGDMVFLNCAGSVMEL